MRGVVRASHGDDSEALRHVETLFEAIRAEGARIVVLSVARQIDGLVAQGRRPPFDVTVGIGVARRPGVPVAPDQALEVRRLRDREDGRRRHRTAPKPYAPHDAATRRRAGSWNARCNAGDRRSPPTGRRSVENPLTLPPPDIRLTSAGWRVKATTSRRGHLDNLQVWVDSPGRPLAREEDVRCIGMEVA